MSERSAAGAPRQRGCDGGWKGLGRGIEKRGLQSASVLLSRAFVLNMFLCHLKSDMWTWLASRVSPRSTQRAFTIPCLISLHVALILHLDSAFYLLFLWKTSTWTWDGGVCHHLTTVYLLFLNVIAVQFSVRYDYDLLMHTRKSQSSSN